MSGIFISHSSLDNDSAKLVRDWLVANGWARSQVFLDLDQLVAGDRWRSKLNSHNTACEAVILCLSDNWLRSHECVRECTFAEAAGKPILPVIVKAISEPIPKFVSDLQFANIADEQGRREGFAKIEVALQKARIGPTYFPWPPRDDPRRPVFPGLRAFEEVDAAIYFGRDALIGKGLDTLRRMRASPNERILAILGASGSGKSSYLRAGLLARLARDPDSFVVLPVVRPERAALTGQRGLLRALAAAGDGSSGRGSTSIGTARSTGAEQLRRADTGVSSPHDERPPTFVLPIDQFEELYAGAQEEADAFLDLLTSAIGQHGNLIAVVTIRSDSFDRLQSNAQLAGMEKVALDLPPLSPASLARVIEGPCSLCNPPITVSPDLTERLLVDLGTGETLPMLALTLERMLLAFGASCRLELEDYTTRLEGLRGALFAAVDAVIDAALADARLPDTRPEIERLLHAVFLPRLVQFDELGLRCGRRASSLDAFDAASRWLVNHLVDQRLLASSKSEQGDVVVEVAHEALFAEWDALKSWIEEEREFLMAKHALERDARRYFLAPASARADYLLKGARYNSALVIRAERPELLSDEEARYLEASRQAHERSRLYADSRAKALSKYVEPILEHKIEELQVQISDCDARARSSAFIRMDSTAKDLQAEIELIRNFLGAGGRWHPEPAVWDRCLGAQADYVDVYRFPCCNQHVLTGSGEPEQFRSDGCEAQP